MDANKALPSEMDLDQEWLSLMKDAKNNGLLPEDVQSFLAEVRLENNK